MYYDYDTTTFTQFYCGTGILQSEFEAFPTAGRNDVNNDPVETKAVSYTAAVPAGSPLPDFSSKSNDFFCCKNISRILWNKAGLCNIESADDRTWEQVEISMGSEVG